MVLAIISVRTGRPIQYVNGMPFYYLTVTSCNFIRKGEENMQNIPEYYTVDCRITL